MMKKKVNVCKTPDEQLTQNENMINEYAAHRSENDDFIFKMLCECIAYSRILYEVKDWHHAQYQCCLGYFYITFRGENYALQAKSHAENSIKLSSYYLNFTNQQINQQNSDSTDNLIILCIILLNYYTLSKSKLILKKNKEAFNLIKQTKKSLNKVEQFLNLIQNSQIISQNTLNYNNNKLEQFKRNLENYYEQWNHCTLLRLDRNFFPNLKLFKLQIYYLYGKIAFEYKKYIVSFDQFIKALRLIEEIYGSESKETIAIYHTLGRIEEYRNSANDMNRSLEYFKKAYEISNKIYNEKGSFHSLVDLARSVSSVVYNLHEIQLKSGE
ncbi:tetratricopeptide repeat 23-like [Schistosoma japonicum]|nr:tetratricopeptide repeat 23-like [Schistosoma japonicum]